MSRFIIRTEILFTLLLYAFIFIAGAAPVKADADTVLRVAFYPMIGFFEYDEEGNETGYGVELLNLISRYTGIKFTYVPAESWAITERMLLDGRADIRMPCTLPGRPSSTIGYTEHSIIDTYYSVMTLKNRDDLFYQDDEYLKSLRIGVTRSLYNSAKFSMKLAETNISAESLVFFDEYNDCRKALAEGKVDAVISNIMNLDDDMKQLDRFATVSNYISMSAGNPYLEKINETLSIIKLNEPDFIADKYEKWFPERVFIPLSKEETKYISSLKEINFVFHDGQGYLARKDSNGIFTGFYPSISRLICDKLGVAWRFSEYQNEDESAVTVYPDFYYDYAWIGNDRVDITQPYFDIKYYEIAKKNHEYDQETCRVATIESFRVTQDYIFKRFSKDQVFMYKDYEDCLDAVINERADVTYVNSYAAEYYLKMFRFNNLSSALIDHSHQACFGVTGDETGLLAGSIEKMLSTITGDEIDALVIENTSISPEQNLFVEWLYEDPFRSIMGASAVAAAFVIMFSLTVFMNKTQKKNMALMEATNAKQNFLARMSHDMRTPMNAIIGFSSLGQECNKLSEAREYYGKINHAAQYLLQLINDSLDLSKLQIGKYSLHLEPFEINEFVESIKNIIMPKAEQKGVELLIRYDETTPTVLMFDKIRLQQIFVNLLNNAVKFTPSGGHASLDITHEKLSAGNLLVHFTVSDNGIGMTEEFQREKLYKPFEQEYFNNMETGTGLGLTIVKDLVDAMGGTISCESKHGEGTTFKIDIKSTLPPGVDVKIKRKKVSFAALKGKRILVCEDHPMNREIIIRLLNKQGIIVDSAENGKIALEKIEQSESGYYFAVLMDIRMPVMDGITAAKEIRSIDRPDTKTVPIIALSANAYETDIDACLKAGMNDHLAKPINPDKLNDALLRFLP